MAPRTPRVVGSKKAIHFGSPYLTLAKILYTTKQLARFLILPLLIGIAYVLLSKLGAFAGLYPWAHLISFVLFALASLDSFHRMTEALAAMSTEKLLRTARGMKKKATLFERDPYGLRYGVAVVLVFGALSLWGALGGRLVEAINPKAALLEALTPPMAAWILPPSGRAPMIIATPAGLRDEDKILDVPVGSTIAVHIREQDGDPPTLEIDGQETPFTTDEHGDFAVTNTLENGSTVTLRQGWQQLGQWHVHMVEETLPVVETKPDNTVERTFSNPVAQRLMAERQRLLERPDDKSLRVEIATLLANLAHRPTIYGHDPVVLLALRTGAVRLMLGEGGEPIEPVSHLLAKTASWIEDTARTTTGDSWIDGPTHNEGSLRLPSTHKDVQSLLDEMEQQSDTLRHGSQYFPAY